MNLSNQWFIGIDVSAKTLDIAATNDQGKTLSLPKVSNNPKGFKQLLKTLQQRFGEAVTWIGLESTSYYHVAAAVALSEQGLSVSVLNPRQVKDYARAQMQRNKTDQADAALIAQFTAHRAQSGRLHRYTPKTPAQQALYEQVRQLYLCERELLAKQNRLASLQDKETIRWLRTDIRCLQRRMKKLEALIVATCEQQAFADHYERLLTIPGISFKSAAVLAEGVHWMDDVRAACAKHALVPSQRQSGSALNRTRLSSDGSRWLRRALYFPTMSAMRCNPLVKAFAQRRREKGLQGKALVCACEHKLMRIICGVLKNETPFNPDILTGKIS